MLLGVLKLSRVQPKRCCEIYRDSPRLAWNIRKSQVCSRKQHMYQSQNWRTRVDRSLRIQSASFRAVITIVYIRQLPASKAPDGDIGIRNEKASNEIRIDGRTAANTPSPTRTRPSGPRPGQDCCWGLLGKRLYDQMFEIDRDPSCVQLQVQTYAQMRTWNKLKGSFISRWCSLCSY